MSGSEIPDIRCPCCGGELDVDVNYEWAEVEIDCDRCQISWDRWGQNPKRWPQPSP